MKAKTSALACHALLLAGSAALVLSAAPAILEALAKVLP